MSAKKVLYVVVRLNTKGSRLANYFANNYKELEDDLEELYPELKGEVLYLCDSGECVLKDSSRLLLHKFEFPVI